MKRLESTPLRVRERKREKSIKRDMKELAKQEIIDCKVLLNAFQTEMSVYQLKYQFGCSNKTTENVKFGCALNKISVM